MKRTYRGAGGLAPALVGSILLCARVHAGIDVCALAPSGLVSWWPAETNANDITYTNDGVLQGGVGFTNAIVGQGFDLNGDGQFIAVSNSPSLNPPGDFTIEGWIWPRQDASQTIMSKWDLAGQQSYLFATRPGRALYFAIADAANQGNPAFQDFVTTNGVLKLNTSNHVAAVYQQSIGVRRIYVNAVLVAQHTNTDTAVLNSDTAVGIGATLALDGSATDYFDGLIDELSYYTSALSASDLQNLTDAGHLGKCPVPPSIIVQPASETVTNSDPASFSVVARGTPPLSYQWQKSGTNISGGLSSGFALLSTTFASAGDYRVVVRNIQGTVTSVVATLTISNRPPTASDVPAATIVNRACSIAIDKLILAASDPDGDPIAFSGASTTSTNGGTVVINGPAVTYTPPLDFIGADRFTYSVNDGRGGSASAFVLLQLLPPELPSKNIFPLFAGAQGTVVQFGGLPFRTYRVQRATSLQGPWTDLTTAQADARGIGSCTDSNPPPGEAFYRTTYP